MAFNTTSFFAGVGTVFAAVMLGFAGGAMITTSPRMEPNRVERVAASTPVVAAKTEAPATPSTETSQTTAAPDRVISLPQKPDTSQAALPEPPPVAPQPQPVMAQDDVASQGDNAKKAREAELKKEADLRKAERRAQQRRERRKQQEIQAAANAVRQMQANGELRQVSREVSQDAGPRFGFFGDN